MKRYIPDTSKYPYPDNTDEHYGSFKMDRGIIFDKDYPYIDESKSFAFKRFWVRLLLRIIVFPFMVPSKMGLKIKGKSILRRYKNSLSGGFISISNHVHDWDYLCVLKAIHNFKWPYLLSIGENINNDSGPLVRMVGGIPIPKKDNKATISFNKTLQKLFEKNGCLHIYPEGSKWDFYTPIRPFKRGAFTLAIKNEIPILPMAFSYREPNWFRRVILKQNGCFTLKIGRPIPANPDLEGNEKVENLLIRSHQAVCHLAGFRNNNIYPPIFNAENRKRKELKVNGK